MGNSIRDYYSILKSYYWPFLTKGLRTLPDFIIIGAQKAGTTSLYALLSKHPDIQMAASKEVWYFDKFYERGLDWYRLNFPLRIQRLINNRMIVGEASPSYVFNHVALQRIRKVLPNIKLILLLRNPIDRAFSHYKHMKRNGRETAKSFEEALNLEFSRTLSGYDNFLGDEDYEFSQLVEDYSYFSKGLYIQQLKRLYSIFNKDQILVLKSEDLFNGNLNTLLDIYNFLGVSIPDPIIFPHFNYDKDELQMDRSIREKLYSLYSRSIIELQEYMNMRFNWDE